MSSEAVVNFDNNESAADDDTQGRTENGIVVPADTSNNPYPNGHSEGYNR